MANVTREEIRNRPNASYMTGHNIGNENLKALPSNTKALKSFLNDSIVAGNAPGGPTVNKVPSLKKLAQNIILDVDTLDVFFEKLAEFSTKSSFSSTQTNMPPLKTQSPKAMNNGLPKTRQFQDYASSGDIQKTVIQNPIQRSQDNAGRPQPVFPN